MITSLYAAILTILFIALSANVIIRRRKAKAALGDGGNLELRKNVRAQGNLAEYAPFFLIMLGCAEHNGLGQLWLNLLGIAFVVGRLFHAYGLVVQEKYIDKKLVSSVSCRIKGVAFTMTTLITLVAILLYQYFSSLILTS